MTIPMPPDPLLGGARGLFGDTGRAVVEAFLVARDWEVQDMRPVQALYRPGASCTVRYRVRALDRSAQRRLLSVCAETRTTPRKLLEPGAEFERRYDLPDPVERTEPYLVWAFPYDPALRGLEDAAWGPAVHSWMKATQDRPRAVAVEPLRYRPTRRALFRYQKMYGDSAPTRSAYGKVLRTLRARTTLDLAETLKRPTGIFKRRPKLPAYLALPGSQIGNNVLLFDPMPGRSLRDLLLSDESLPEPQRVVGLMRSLQDLAPKLGGVASARHRPPATTAAASAALLSQLIPEMAAEVQALAHDVAIAAEQDAVPRAVVHGDFYDAQVLVQDDFSLGLVDVDDLGLGDPALDAANFTTHLLALALVRPASKSRLLAYRTLSREAFIEKLGITPADLTWREALVMMQLAPGPFRVLEPNWPDRLTQHVHLARRLLDQDAP